MNDILKYDAIVIGSGQGGNPLAITLAEEGWKTAIIERARVGGTCINWGCTPTKTMIASARMAYLARKAEEYGVKNGRVSVDMTVVRQRKREIVESFRQGSLAQLEDSSVMLIRGEARFIGPKRLEVEMNGGLVQRLSADKVIIDTGARPREPEIPDLEIIPYLDSTSIMEVDFVPEHLMVLGGGYVGVEFAQMFRRFGSQVTLIEAGDQLLVHEDRDVAEELAGVLEEEGVEILFNRKPIFVQPQVDDGARIILDVENGGQSCTLTGTHLLVAAGRVPNTDALNLDVAGIKTDETGHIEVNQRLETSVEGVYAIGDVKGGPAFTHISYDDYRILRANLLEKGRATVQDRLVPYTVFTDPQLGRVGITEKEARSEGIDYLVAKMDMSSVARALEIERTRGMMKALVDPESDQILGCAILGVQGGEIMAILQVAMMGGLPYTDLQEGVFTHPTLAESLNNLFSNLKEPD